MDQNNPRPVRIQILGKEYRLACPASEEEALRNSANYLEKEMSQIRSHSKALSAGNDMLLMVAALNITNKLLTEQQLNLQYQATVANYLSLLQQKVEHALE
jgi:cell division protein ZapA